MAKRLGSNGGQKIKKKGPGHRAVGRSPARDGDPNLPLTPRVEDVRFVEDHKLPAIINDRVLPTVADAFTGRACATLSKEEVRKFYGVRLKSEQILHDSELCQEGLSVAARFVHGAAMADQITAPALVRLANAASLIMRDIAELQAEYPSLAEGLKDLVDWWTATYPGGGPKAKGDTTSPAAPAKAPAKAANPAPAASTSGMPNGTTPTGTNS